jgi:DNA-binding NarL/FixJ family response regulator
MRRPARRAMPSAPAPVAAPGRVVPADHGVRLDHDQMAARIRPDVVLMDVRLPDVGAVLASRTIRTNLPSSHILFLSTTADFRTVLAAVLSGVSRHVLKSLELAPLQEAIEAAGHGRMRLDPRIAEGVVEWFCDRGVKSSDRGTSVTLGKADMLLLTNIASRRLDSELAPATGRPLSDIQSEVARLYEVLNEDRGFLATGNALARLLTTPGRG